MKVLKQKRTFWRRRIRQSSATGQPHVVLSFIKEWGAALTVLIAILYTFPFDAISKIITWRERNVVSARAAVSQLAELTASKILALKKIKDDNDPNETQFLTNTFNIRIYNILTTNRVQFQDAMKDLSASELYSLASNYTLNSLVADAIPFYNAALDKSRDSDVGAYVAASRELGLALTYNTSKKDISESIRNYLNALTEITKKENHIDPGTYAIDLAELALTELKEDDWKCGIEATAIARDIFSKVVLSYSQYPQSTQYYQYVGAQRYFEQALSSAKKRPGQKEDGCKFTIPKMYNF